MVSYDHDIPLMLVQRTTKYFKPESHGLGVDAAENKELWSNGVMTKSKFTKLLKFNRIL